MKRLVVLVMTVAVLATASLNAQPGRRGMHGKQAMVERGQHQGMLPDLTEDQKDKIKAIHLEARKSSLPIQNSLREKEARLQTLITSENIDKKEVEKIMDDIGSMKTDLHKKRVETRLAVRELLTEEQRIIFDSRRPGMGRRGAGPHGQGNR